MRLSNRLLTFTVLASCVLSMNCSNRQSSTPVQAETNSPAASNPAPLPSDEKATTPENVSRLEALVAEHEKRLAAVEAQLARIASTTSGAAQTQPKQLSGTSPNNGTRFIGTWYNRHGYFGGSLSISKDGDQYIVRQHDGNVYSCELSNGSLKCGEGVIGFIESSGHITWHGEELQKLPQTSR
jgi:hypothetical protein